MGAIAARPSLHALRTRIDSWDFQPRDKYLVPFRFGIGQTIDPARTKFTIFFGDNTAYAHACDQLAEMLNQAGRTAEAGQYSERARQIRTRLDALAWNGARKQPCPYPATVSWCTRLSRGEAGTRRRHSFKGRLTMGQEMEHP